LRHPRVRLLFLIREPAASLRSVVSLTKTFYEAWPVAKATNYYVQRLSTLARYAEMLPPEGRALALTYQDLTDNTPATFARLQAFLGRDTGFSEHYDLQEFTGKRGDPSENIRTGRIVRDRATAPVEIPPAEIERASVAFEACHHALERLR
jgi:hypothetical protein